MKVSASLCSILFVVACGSVNEDKGTDGGTPDGSTVDAEVDAPPIACTQTTCTNDMLEVCGSDNLVERTEQCGLGCFTDGTRCNAIVPSNGLSSAVDQAAQQGDITLPDGATINTDSGLVSSLQGTLAVATTTVAQPGGAMLRVLIAKSFTIGNVKISGASPIAFVASGPITVQGVVDVSADRGTAGPGSSSCTSGDGGSPTGGHWERGRVGQPMYVWMNNGGGGGGFGTPGGAGGLRFPTADTGAAGPANGEATLVPLRGGCAGYSNVANTFGAGGGAIQLVSNEQVRFIGSSGSNGVINASGGGGNAVFYGTESDQPGMPSGSLAVAAGGGSGGGILIEAPRLILEDGTGLLTRGGGGGGSGPCLPVPNGADASVSALGTGGTCGTSGSPGGAGAASGAGGTGGAVESSGGGGGGGAGRIRINTRTGQATPSSEAVLDGVLTQSVVGVR